MVNPQSKRVAAVACELGRTIGLPDAELKVLETAALLHRCDPGLLDGPALSRLAVEVLGYGEAYADFSGPAVTLSENVTDVLRAFHSNGAGVGAQLSELIHLAESLDACMEWEPYGLRSDEQDPAEFMWESPLLSASLSRLRAATLEELRRITPELPPFPQPALHALSRLVREDVGADEVTAVAATDPSFAGKLIATANSALLSPRREIRSLPQAVSYIGTVNAKKILIAAAAMPLFAPASMRSLHVHSLESADIAAQIAVSDRRIPPAEAFLAGLIHDIGALALGLVNKEAIARRDRLTASGCPQTYAEQVVCGFDHAQAGAVVLEHWGFPKDVVHAVEHHHRPERSESSLAALLYATEFWTCSEEDLPSAFRLQLALKRLGVTPELLNERNPHASPALLSTFAMA